MSFDAPLAERAPTRRSSRPLITPAPAQAEESTGTLAAPRARADDAVSVVAMAEATPPPTRRARRAAEAAPQAGPSADASTEAVLVRPTVPPVDEKPAATPGRRVRTAPVLLDAVHVPVEPFELLEPENVAPTEPVEAELPEDVAPAASDLDEFEAAARLFAFTGENPIMDVASDVAPEVQQPAHAAPRGKRSRRGSAFKRATAASFSIGVMGVVGLLAVGLTTPVEAVAAASGTTPATMSLVTVAGGDVESAEDEIQAYVAPSQLATTALQRVSNYETGTLVDLAGVAGIANYSSSVFSNNTNCAIQWPFAVGVPVSYGFGYRSGSLHEGIDFTPGEGAHIQAIADGVVRISTDSGGAYGATVVIDHVIDGQLVSSRYAHLLYGTRQVAVGETVSVGQFIGETGDTGRSFGAHTHFEILSGGTTAIDPMPWLRSHATC